jgi:hypothetical protein
MEKLIVNDQLEKSINKYNESKVLTNNKLKNE